ncbi:MAG: lipoyl synthase [Nanoarchaeota archaeon]
MDINYTIPKIKIKDYDKKKYLELINLINKNNLKTVCISANCPNRYECFSNGNATFMILGDICTRNCKYCNISNNNNPKKIDKEEPKRIATTIKKLNLNYAVITCVTRDDIEDGGAKHFQNVIYEIRKNTPNCKIEVLISDLKGNWDALKIIINSNPDVINHNIEVVRDFFNQLRPQGNYDLSLKLLKKIKEINPKIITKSGFMIGFGEDEKQIIKTIHDLNNAKCNLLTIGQYLQPSNKHVQVQKYYSQKEFNKIKKYAKEIGKFKNIYSGFLVRSSYKAGELI